MLKDKIIIHCVDGDKITIKKRRNHIFACWDSGMQVAMTEEEAGYVAAAINQLLGRESVLKPKERVQYEEKK